jgi:hypothetical protein
MKVEGVDYSHVALVFETESLGRSLVYQATTKGVNFMSFDNFTESNTIVDGDAMAMNPEERKAVLQFCIDNAGKPYGYLEVLGIGLRRLVQLLFKRDIGNVLADGDKSYFCVELLIRLLSVKNLQHPNPSAVGLKEIKDVVQGHIYGQD